MAADDQHRYIEYKEEPERLILVGIDPAASPNGSEAENSLDELAELVETAGAEAVFYVMQFRDKPHPVTYVGSGKLDELRMLVAARIWYVRHESTPLRACSSYQCRLPYTPPFRI